MLKVKKVELDGEEFEVREPTIEGMLPVLKKLGNEDQRMEAQVDILKITVFRNGEAMGDAVNALGWSMFSRLVPHALSVCGMTDDADDAA